MPRKVVRRRRRRNFRKKYPIGKPRVGINQGVYLFKRRTTQVIPLANSEIPSGSGWFTSSDNGIYKQWAFNLAQVNDVTDFSALFKQYKICGVKLELSFNNTQSSLTGGPTGTPNVIPGGQLQVYTIPNKSGKSRNNVTDPLTEKICLDTQACKKRLALNGGKPIKIYMRTNQLSQMYASAVNTDYGVVKPRYISTGETGTEHYGVEMYINRVDGKTLSSNLQNEQSVRITATYYIACKGVN